MHHSNGLPGEVWGWGGEIEFAIDVILDKESTWWAAANAEDIIPSTTFCYGPTNRNWYIFTTTWVFGKIFEIYRVLWS